MSSAERFALLEISDGVATITFNRPDVLNAFDRPMADHLIELLRAIELDAAARCIVLQGAGAAFMAGGDIGYFNRLVAETPDPKLRRERIFDIIDGGHALTETMRRLPKPIIASVHGGCAGFGMSLMFACDLAVVADDAKFTLAYIKLGATPDGGATFFLPRLVGQKRAAEIALLGDRFGAAEAERWGLVNRVVPAAERVAATRTLALRLAQGPALAYGRTKALLEQSTINDLSAQLRAEANAFADGVVGGDFAEGVQAFLEKRPPRFTGR